LAVKVIDPATKETCYMKIKDIAHELIGNDVQLTNQSKKRICERILEITAPDTRAGVSKDKMIQLFQRFYQDKAKGPQELKSSDSIIKELETIKLDIGDISPIYYENSLLEVVKDLKPGDIIIRKYHEDHPNPICDAQKFFHQDGYREAFKCSHLALYLGEINGDYWVAEASMPHGDEPQMRRVKINDSHFDLKEKNQYLVMRRKDQDEAKEAARLAKNYVVKMLPETEKPLEEGESENALKYTIIEATRSLWHSNRLGFFGKHRLFKYYSDYKNGIAFEYMGKNRAFFCSQFALIMESMAELNKSRDFQDFIKKHPMPEKYDETKKGFALEMSKLWYSIRKGAWSRWMSFRYGNEIEKCVKTKLDALRTSPQEALIYMLDHKDQFEAVGLITHRKDYLQPQPTP
jgi:hypothetical protein